MGRIFIQIRMPRGSELVSISTASASKELNCGAQNPLPNRFMSICGNLISRRFADVAIF